MKKLMTIAAVLTVAASMAYAASNEVYSVNVVGFQKVELPPAGTYILTTCNFEAGSSNTLTEIFGTNTLRQDDSPAKCDRIYIYDAYEKVYQTWAQWTDGVFYKANDLDEWNLGIAGDPEVPNGAGFFIASPSTSTETNMITYVGDVVAATTQSIPIVPSYQILSYPYSTDIALQDTSFFADGAQADDSPSKCDRILVYENGVYQTYAVWTDGNWYKANDLDEWNQGILATNVIKAGEAFFYNAVTNMVWAETNKYLDQISQ